MARFGKTVGAIEKLVAMARGVGSGRVRRNRQDVYVVQFVGNGSHARLLHYGTETALVDVNRKLVLRYYGESNSDRDSMNTFLDCLDFPRNVYFRNTQDDGFKLYGQEGWEARTRDHRYVGGFEGIDMSEAKPNTLDVIAVHS